MLTLRTSETTSPGKGLGEMKIFHRSQESERQMLVNANIQATSLVNKHARKQKASGKTPLVEESQENPLVEESQESLSSTQLASKRLGEVRRMGQTIFRPHIMHNRSNTKYSDIFPDTYKNTGQFQLLYDSGTLHQSNKKERSR